VVQGGDTLLKIARETGVAVPELIALNEAVYPSLRSQPDVIYVGWVLKLK
jgi:LysM repeat protein